MGRNSSSHGTGTGALAEDTMSNQTLTYRGLTYESQSGLLNHLLKKYQKELRLEKEMKKDRERMAAGPAL